MIYGIFEKTHEDFHSHSSWIRPWVVSPENGLYMTGYCKVWTWSGCSSRWSSKHSVERKHRSHVLFSIYIKYNHSYIYIYIYDYIYIYFHMCPCMVWFGMICNVIERTVYADHYVSFLGLIQKTWRMDPDHWPFDVEKHIQGRPHVWQKKAEGFPSA